MSKRDPQKIWDRDVYNLEVKEHKKMAHQIKDAVNQYKSFKKLLRQHPTVKNINHVISYLSKDKTLWIPFDYYKGFGIESKSDTLDNIHVDSENDWEGKYKKLHKHDYRKAKASHSKWFLTYDTWTNKHPLHRITAHDCQRVLNQAIFIKSRIEPKQCATIILHWIEGFSSDDYTDDVSSMLKPVATLVHYQCKLDDLKFKNMDESGLMAFQNWYRCIDDHVYHPSYVDSVPTYSPIGEHESIVHWIDHKKLTGHKKQRFPARDDRIDIDDLQSFLTPLAVVFADYLHTKVHFQWS